MDTTVKVGDTLYVERTVGKVVQETSPYQVVRIIVGRVYISKTRYLVPQDTRQMVLPKHPRYTDLVVRVEPAAA